MVFGVHSTLAPWSQERLQERGSGGRFGLELYLTLPFGSGIGVFGGLWFVEASGTLSLVGQWNGASAEHAKL